MRSVHGKHTKNPHTRTHAHTHTQHTHCVSNSVAKFKKQKKDSLCQSHELQDNIEVRKILRTKFRAL